MTKTLIIVIVALIAGYLLGNFIPLRNFSSSDQTNPGINNQSADDDLANIPAGKGLLEVTVVNSDNQPMVGIEIDVAVQPGPPEGWGMKEADTNGTAEFELSPGDYFVYFNTSRFPSGYQVQPEQKVSVREGQVKQITIILEKN